VTQSIGEWLENLWYGKKPPNRLLGIAAQVFSWVVQARIYLYRKGFFASSRLDAPVIAIGNLTVGGTGKTPLTIRVVEILQQHGFKPGIVSRGYGGKKHSRPVTVEPNSSPALYGDEPVLIAERTGCPVSVFKNRSLAAQHLIKNFGCNVIIADDALQHYRLKSDIEIAVIDGLRGFGNERMLPQGPLREPLYRLQKVDLIVQNSGKLMNDEYFPMSLSAQKILNLRDPQRSIELADLIGAEVVAMAGTGNPESFFKLLVNNGLTIEAHEFADHHAFRTNDLDFVGDRLLLMTEKDAVKCRNFARDNHWFLPIDATLPESFEDSLLTLVELLKYGQKAS
jgi:tetraacyldisaccharide 4'-kinase